MICREGENSRGWTGLGVKELTGGWGQGDAQRPMQGPPKWLQPQCYPGGKVVRKIRSKSHLEKP